MQKALVGIIMGSDSDLLIMSEAAKILEIFNTPYELTVVSAHRTPQKMFGYAQTAVARGLKVIIAGAGGAAHLPGMIASLTPLPVIGVPVQTKTMNGIDSLYSIVQMPPGVPVATVAINGARNAGILAAQILAVTDQKLLIRVEQYKKNLEKTVLQKAENLEKIGYKRYVKNPKNS